MNIDRNRPLYTDQDGKQWEIVRAGRPVGNEHYICHLPGRYPRVAQASPDHPHHSDTGCPVVIVHPVPQAQASERLLFVKVGERCPMVGEWFLDDWNDMSRAGVDDCRRLRQIYRLIQGHIPPDPTPPWQ